MTVHYCAYPERRSEPTLCGLPRYDDGVVEADGGRTTTSAADVTCSGCLDVLEGRAP